MGMGVAPQASLVGTPTPGTPHSPGIGTAGVGTAGEGKWLLTCERLKLRPAPGQPSGKIAEWRKEFGLALANLRQAGGARKWGWS